MKKNKKLMICLEKFKILMITLPNKLPGKKGNKKRLKESKLSIKTSFYKALKKFKNKLMN